MPIQLPRMLLYRRNRLIQCRVDLEHDTLATPRFRYRFSAVRSVDTENEENRIDSSHSYYQADLASHRRRAMRLQTMDVRPTSQRRTASQPFSAAPTAADDDDDDFLDFSRDNIFFHQHFRSLIDDDD